MIIKSLTGRHRMNKGRTHLRIYFGLSSSSSVKRYVLQ